MNLLETVKKNVGDAFRREESSPDDNGIPNMQVIEKLCTLPEWQQAHYSAVNFKTGVMLAIRNTPEDSREKLIFYSHSVALTLSPKAKEKLLQTYFPEEYPVKSGGKTVDSPSISAEKSPPAEGLPSAHSLPQSSPSQGFEKR
jgi:hypothetical protein